MPHLLHIDSSIRGAESVSRKLTARAVAAWLAAHPGGTVTHRDLGRNPVPHLSEAANAGRMLPPSRHTEAQAASWALMAELTGEIKAADTVLLGLPLYNYGAPSAVKAWVDHLVTPGLAFDPETQEGLLGGREFIVIASRGGGYGPGTPREGWDHAEPWLPHGLSLTGLEPRVIAAELTLAPDNPAMADLIPVFEQGLAAAEAEIDKLWAPVAA